MTRNVKRDNPTLRLEIRAILSRLFQQPKWRLVAIICVLIVVFVTLLDIVDVLNVSLVLSSLRSKTAWDWLELLIVPAILAGSALWFSSQQRKNDIALAKENTRDSVLNSYLDRMTDLLMKSRASDSEAETNVYVVARTLTLATLSQLDPVRKVIVLRFLYEARLIESGDARVDLHGADLRGIRASAIMLERANLEGVDLRDADLSEARLTGSRLDHALLDRANLKGACLSEASLFCASLEWANMGPVPVDPAADVYELMRKDPHRPIMGKQSRLDFANMERTNLRNAVLIGAILDGANLRYADLRRSNLLRASLKAANLYGANLIGASLVASTLQDADCTKVSFAGLRVESTSLGAITGKSFEQLFSQKNNWEFADLHLADLKATNLSDAVISKEQLAQAKLIPDSEGG